jgi:cell division protein FtsB
MGREQRRNPGGSGPGGRPSRGSRSGGPRAGGARAGGVGGARVAGARAGRPDAGRAEPPRGERPDPTRGRAPGTSRPAGVRRTTTGGAAKRTRAPQPRRFTGRAAVLGAVLLGLLLAYAYPVRVYLAQQAEIAGIEQQQEQQRRRIAGLAEERRKWDDDEFVKAKAKKELQYVLPGETPFVTLPDPAQAGAAAPATQPGPALEPWYQKLWTSVGAADRAGAK